MATIEEDNRENIEKNQESTKTEQERSPEEVDVVEESSSEVHTEPSSELVAVTETDIKMSIFSKLKEIDTLYKKGVLQYSETLQRYNIEIEKLKSEIELESQKNSNEERAFFATETVLEHESKQFEQLHHKFTQKVASLTELRDEYKESLEESIYNVKLLQKENELFTVMEEIEEKEISLLNQELEKINLSNILAKKQSKVEGLKRSLKEIELEKNYFESTELQKLSYLNPEQLRLPSGKPKEVVDTDVVE